MSHTPTHTRPIDELSEEARAHLAAGGALRNGQIPEGASAITGDMLEPQNAFSVPPAPQGQDFAGTIAGIPTIESLVSEAQAPTQAETQQKTIQQRLLYALQKLSGKETAQLEAEEAAGVPGLEKQVIDINAQIKMLQAEAQAIPLQIQQESIGRGRTAAGVAPIETARLRDISIRALGLSAISSALQGNLLAAQTQADRAVKMKFADAENQVEFLKTAYLMNKDALERVDKQRADALRTALAERERVLTDQKEKDKEIYMIGLTGQKFGAPPELVQKAFEAKTREEAVGILGEFLQDPKAKIELEAARVDILLKKEQIRKVQRERELLGEPTEKEKKATEKALLEASTSALVAQDKIEAVNVLSAHSGMSSRVGTTFITRGGTGGIIDTSGRFLAGAIPGLGVGVAAGLPAGGVGAIPGAIIGFGVGGVAGLATAGPVSGITGAGQDFAGGIHKLTGGLTLESLIEAKARGATFGALSDSELKILADAATAISDWEIKNDKNVGIGFWDVSEKDFKREMKVIQDLTRRALERSQGKLFTDEEQAIFDALEEVSGGEFNPASFY